MSEPLPATLTPVQLEIMNLVWDRGEATVTDVWQGLLEEREISRGSVQTMLIRLEEKGWIEHREVGQAFLYRARFPRDFTQKQMVRDLADRVFGGSTEGLLCSLLDDCGLSKAEAQRLRELIDSAERKRRRRSR